MDLKTLRLASIALTPELLEQFVVYQRTLLAELTRSSEADWSGRYAFAHGKALAESKLDLVTLGKVKAQVGEFCGKRSAVLRVEERVRQAEASPEAAKSQKLIQRAKDELPKLQDFRDFEARYGAAAMAALRLREAELLQLHRALAQAEGGEGHLHQPS